jgi:hypothetical protein
LTVLQREERKKKELTKQKMRTLINPVLYAEEIDGNVSIAYTMLSEEQKD